MAARDLREAFNAVASPRYVADKATLGYERAHDVEWQVLTFSGRGADGNAFSHVEKVKGDVELNNAARVAAQKLLDQKEPMT